MKRLLVVIALVLGCVPADGSLRLRGTIGPPEPPAGPILNNVEVNVGEYTRSGGGGVRLSSMDDATSYGVPVYGLGLQDPNGTACATWTVTRVSGTSGHFNMVSAQAEGTSAITPTPTGTGVTAHLNGGPYVFNVSCTDANGNASNTATLTYNIIDDAANVDEFIGNFPAVTSGYASFASTAGYKLLVPTGFKKLTSATWSIVCSSECTLTWADITKPGLFQSFRPNANQLTKLRVKDITCTGDGTQNCFTFSNPSNAGTTLALESVGCKFKPQDATDRQPACLDTRWPGAPGNNITDFSAEWVGLGIRIAANGYNIRNAFVKNYSVNAMDVNVADDLTMYDWLFWNPQVGVGGYHGDCWQVTNGASNKNWDIRRGGCVTAGGYGPTQGPIFPGHSTRARGYISDGAGGAGLNITLTGTVHDPNAFFDEGVDGSQIIAPGCITAAENARIASSANSGVAVLTGISARLCGSAASPIDIYTYTMENVAVRGVIHSGYSTWGWAQSAAHGTGGIQNFAYVHQEPEPTYATYGSISITGSTLTVTPPLTSNATDANATYNAGIAFGGAGTGYGLSYEGLTGGVLTVTAKTSNGSSTYCNKASDIGKTCVYTLSRAPGNVSGLTGTFVVPVGGTSPTQGPQLSFMESDTADLYTGSGQLVKDGFVSAGCLFPLGGGSYGSPPANMTVENCWDYNTAPPADNFDKGDPKLAFEAISIADWNAKTAAQVLATYCSYMLPKDNGEFDNGDGTWASPFKPDSDADGDAEWWDGTDIDGCS